MTASAAARGSSRERVSALTNDLQPSRMSPGLRIALGILEGRLRSRFQHRLRQIRLFGSYARFEATEDSDLDVAIVVDGLSTTDRAAVIDEVHRIEQQTDFFLSPFILSVERFDELITQ